SGVLLGVCVQPASHGRYAVLHTVSPYHVQPASHGHLHHVQCASHGQYTSIDFGDNKPVDVGTPPACGSPPGFQPSEPPQRCQRVLHATFGHPNLFGKLASGTPCALIPLVFRVEVHVP